MRARSVYLVPIVSSATRAGGDARQHLMTRDRNSVRIAYLVATRRMTTTAGRNSYRCWVVDDDGDGETMKRRKRRKTQQLTGEEQKKTVGVSNDRTTRHWIHRRPRAVTGSFAVLSFPASLARLAHSTISMSLILNYWSQYQSPRSRLWGVERCGGLARNWLDGCDIRPADRTAQRCAPGKAKTSRGRPAADAERARPVGRVVRTAFQTPEKQIKPLWIRATAAGR